MWAAGFWNSDEKGWPQLPGAPLLLEATRLLLRAVGGRVSGEMPELKSDLGRGPPSHIISGPKPEASRSPEKQQ